MESVIVHDDVSAVMFRQEDRDGRQMRIQGARGKGDVKKRSKDALARAN